MKNVYTTMVYCDWRHNFTSLFHISIWKISQLTPNIC